MARFLNRPLGALDRIFKFEGAQKTSSLMDLENPIQMVLDVSRFAQEGIGPYQGIVRYDGLHTHGAANQQVSVVNIVADLLNPLGYVPDAGASGPGQHGADTDFAVYLMAVAIRAGATGILSWASVARQSPQTPPYPVLGTPAVQAEALVQYKTADTQPGYTGIGNTYPLMPSNSYFPLRFPPIRLFPSDVVSVQSTTTASGTITYGLTFWVGRAGTGPPGFA